MRTLHIVIGSGPLGRATAKALRHDGHAVMLINRSGTLKDPPEGVKLYAMDIEAYTHLPIEMRDAAALYFCAQPAYHRWAEEFPALQEAAIALASNIGARLIVAENLYGYGIVAGPMREDMPLQPISRKGLVRAAMHERLMQAHRSGQLQVAVARGSDFFGPHVEGSAVGTRVFHAIIAGKAAEVIGDPDTLHDYTYVEDFGRAMAILGTDARALGHVWHVPNAETVSTRKFLELAYASARYIPRIRRLRKYQLMLLGVFIPAVRETVEMLYEFTMPHQVSHAKFTRTFGEIATPFDVSVKHTVQWMQEHTA